MVTVCIILNYNDIESTLTLLKKIKEYSELDYIVVVDNKSTDKSIKVLNEIISDNIKVISTDKNGGYGYGNNYGIRYAVKNLSATHILISNPDVDFSNECVKTMKNMLIEHDECSIVAPVTYQKNKIVAWKTPNLFWEIGNNTFAFRLFFGSKNKYNDYYFMNKDFCYVDVISGALLMVDANIMIKYGMYDEDMFLYNEEKVLASKMFLGGYKSLLLLNLSYIHYHSISVTKSIKSLVKLKKISNQSEIIYLEKYRGLKGINLFLVKIYLKYALIEMYIVSLIKKVIKK